jgi:hypothetical protein
MKNAPEMTAEKKRFLKAQLKETLARFEKDSDAFALYRQAFDHGIAFANELRAEWETGLPIEWEKLS